jgi:hypothetical protein
MITGAMVESVAKHNAPGRALAIKTAPGKGRIQNSRLLTSYFVLAMEKGLWRLRGSEFSERPATDHADGGAQPTGCIIMRVRAEL